MKNKQDLRITRTHKMIKEAFFKLMEKESFEKISVQAIADVAMVSRTTFYLHFLDKYDLLDKIENEVLDEIKGMVIGFALEDAIADISSKKPFTILLQMYEYIKENRQFFVLIMGENGDPSFFYKLYETIIHTVPQSINVDRLKIPQHYAVALLIGVHTSIINEWLKTGLKETPEEMITMITQVMRDVPKNIYRMD